MTKCLFCIQYDYIKWLIVGADGFVDYTVMVEEHSLEK